MNLLWSQCFHRVEVGGFPCGEEPKGYADTGADHHGDDYPDPGENQGEVELQCDDVSRHNASKNTDYSSCNGEEK